MSSLIKNCAGFTSRTIKRALRRLLLSAGFELRRTGIEPKVFSPFVRHISGFGTEFDLWIASPSSDTWYRQYDEMEQFSEFREFRRLIQEGDRVLEIGCHHGFYALFLAGFAGSSGYVLGVEAHPGNALILDAQAGLNPDRKLRFINLNSAVGSDELRF